MKCNKCGAEISNNSSFCPNCGQQVVSATKEKKPMSKGIKFLITLLRVVCFILIFTDMLFILFITKFQGMTLKELWELALGGDWIMFLLLVGALPYVLAYLLMFHIFKKFIAFAFMLIGIGLCGLCLIKAKKGFMIFMFALMGIFLILGIYAFIQMQNINEIIDQNLNSSSST